MPLPNEILKKNNMETFNGMGNFISNLSFTDIIGWIGYITTGVIVLAVSFRSVIDVLKATGVFHRNWMDSIYKNEDERIRRALEQMGVLSRANHYKSLTLALNSGFVPMTNEECKKELNELSKKFVEKESLIVGDTSEEKLNYYLNLRKAFCIGHADVMINLICSLVTNKSREEGIVYDCIVSRKSGLDLLGYHVSHVLGIPFVLYHDQRSILKDNKIKAFDYLPEGIKKPIIIDDSCMGGGSIASLANNFKSETNIAVEHAFILFTRKRESSDKVKKAGSFLHYLEFYDDSSLSNLLKR